MVRLAISAALTLALVAGCGSNDGDGAVRGHVADATAEVRAGAGDEELRATIAKLRADHPSSADTQKAQRLAIAGLTATLAGRESRRAFVENDSGNIEAATRDAKRAYRSFRRATRLLAGARRLSAG